MAITQRDIDKVTLSKEKYIFKYYYQVNLDTWFYWMEDTIDKAWDKERRQYFLKDWGDRMKNFDFMEMERFYKEEDLSNFDEDIKKFISFLAGDGFLKKNAIDFQNWFLSKNFTNPGKNDLQDLSIFEALKLKGGMNYIRKQLLNLYWWR